MSRKVFLIASPHPDEAELGIEKASAIPGIDERVNPDLQNRYLLDTKEDRITLAPEMVINKEGLILSRNTEGEGKDVRQEY